jgi:hypothetical protein
MGLPSHKLHQQPLRPMSLSSSGRLLPKHTTIDRTN